MDTAILLLEILRIAPIDIVSMKLTATNGDGYGS